MNACRYSFFSFLVVVSLIFLCTFILLCIYFVVPMYVFLAYIIGYCFLYSYRLFVLLSSFLVFVYFFILTICSVYWVSNIYCLLLTGRLLFCVDCMLIERAKDRKKYQHHVTNHLLKSFYSLQSFSMQYFKTWCGHLNFRIPYSDTVLDHGIWYRYYHSLL